NFNAVPVISGVNRDETRLFNALNPDLVKFVFSAIPTPRNPPLFDAVSDYQSLMWRVRAVDDPLQDMTSGGHGDVWAYRFDWDEGGSVGPVDLGQLFGAGHGLEIPFVFNNYDVFGLDPLFTEANAPGRRTVSDAMTSYWVEFARTGDPGRGVNGDLPEWTRWPANAEADGPTLMVFDTEAGGGVRMEDGTVAASDVEAALLSDPRLDHDVLRCSAYVWVSDWAPDTFKGSNRAGCK
ncbi:MAG: carboxylesterase family protein, partial [Pseudomonadota bacterium]